MGTKRPQPEEPGRPRRRGRWMRRAVIRLLLICVLVLAGLLAWNYYKERLFDAGGIANHKTELTDSIVKEKLQSIGQLVTYSYEYTDIREIKDSRQIFGMNIPGTTHTIRLAYNGMIKVGYEVSEIGIRVDNENRVIEVILPDPKVTDNYIDMDTLSYAEQNNIFNPIRGEEITGELDEIKRAELERAVEAGIYELAAGNAKAQISGLLEAFDGYTVKFT